MSQLVECLVDGGVWIVGDWVVDREYFEQMPFDHYRQTYSGRLAFDGFEYLYDGLVPDFDFSNGLENAKITFHLTKDNIVSKYPV